MLILVLEASTSSAKALLYQSGVGIIGVLPRNYSAQAGDIARYDGDQIIAETLETGGELLRQHHIDRVDLVATCSIWSHSLVMLDRENKPIAPLMTWADTAAAVTTQKYRRDEGLFKTLYQRTGCPIHTTYTLWKYVHEKEHGDVSRVARIGSMPEYLFFKLTGKWAVSQSTTSAGGFLNIHELSWDEEALRIAGITAGKLPELVDAEYTAPLSKGAAERLGVVAGTPVLITGADGCMNQIAAGGFGANIMTMSVGTSGALRLTVDRPVLAEYPSTWCYVGVEEQWIAGSATAGAGNCVDWIGKKILGYDNRISLSELDEGAKETLGKGEAPIFLPFLTGERCPGWDDTKEAMFWGMKMEHNLYDLYYAVLEGVLFNLRQCYELTVPVVGNPPERISISGGIEKSPMWLKMAASIFGLPVHTGGLLHASLLGAAYMGLKVGGEIPSVKAIQPTIQTSWEPEPGREKFFAGRFEKYLEYYAAQTIKSPESKA